MEQRRKPTEPPPAAVQSVPAQALGDAAAAAADAVPSEAVPDQDAVVPA
jgi:hypothetical protein